MKSPGIFFAGLFVFVFLFPSCKKENKSNDELILGSLIFALTRTPYEEVTPPPGTFTLEPNKTFTRSYSPTCSGVPENEIFKFYIKRGTTKNLLINFMGGGACWDPKNCFGSKTATYFNRANIFNPLAARLAFHGILEERVFENPFKDWNVVFIPYCTGDLHWGSKIIAYVDPTNNQTTDFKHKGFDNVLSVLNFIKNSEEYRPNSDSKVSVTGQSAGAYGAIFNFPYIRETLRQVSDSNIMVLGDAGNGVVPTNFQQNAVIDKWGADSNLPNWITFPSFSTMSFGVFYNTVATEYPNSRIAQYSTDYDGNQRYFYDVQLKIAIQSPYTSAQNYSDSENLWGKSDGTQVPDSSVTCSWRTQSRTKLKTEVTQPNYRYYIASGDVHTISTSVNFFSESSAGQSLVDWYNQMLVGGAGWVNRDCLNLGNCNPPKSAYSYPNTISCP
ncbi:pectin acetylesterase-family hydrolase [Leptospira sp. 96542]|nr:pectin acetylesterase-family hydrolase [Leptospira sp. 96542]